MGAPRNVVELQSFFALEELRKDKRRIYRVTAPYMCGTRTQQAIFEGSVKVFLVGLVDRYRWVPWRDGKPFSNDYLLTGTLAVDAIYSNAFSKLEIIDAKQDDNLLPGPEGPGSAHVAMR